MHTHEKGIDKSTCVSAQYIHVYSHSSHCKLSRAMPMAMNLYVFCVCMYIVYWCFWLNSFGLSLFLSQIYGCSFPKFDINLPTQVYFDINTARCHLNFNKNGSIKLFEENFHIIWLCSHPVCLNGACLKLPTDFLTNHSIYHPNSCCAAFFPVQKADFRTMMWKWQMKWKICEIKMSMANWFFQKSRKE